MTATATESIFHMAYISQANEELGYNDIDEILITARINNPSCEITGVLIHSDGYFVQLLEGPSEKTVKQALARIITDERHSHLRVIGEWFSASRFFDHTPMGFCDSDLHLKHSCFSYFQNLFDQPINSSTNPKAEGLVNFFADFSNSGIELK